MDYHRQIRRQTTDDRTLQLLPSRAFKTNTLQTSSFGVPQRSVAATPTKKSLTI
ncbi:hypothetical protein [Chamaesiphon sp. VAR_48_metabat_403]|uniref:hypothetical protein n=1 Tax=Chamaesiphon sp. VAR_48_metabat_403 TaxID=2964700 RepID=UPI00286E62E0|nr:hypothetical protein [Chamaesiphon sp. VAR_48_metabat_403]